MPRYMVKVKRADGGYDRYGVDANNKWHTMDQLAKRLGLDGNARVGVRHAREGEKLLDLPPKRKETMQTEGG